MNLKPRYSLALAVLAPLLAACSSAPSFNEDSAVDVADVTKTETVVVIPIMQHDGRLLSENNASYKAVGEAEFPDVLEFTTKNLSAKRDEFSELGDRSRESKSKSGGELLMFAYDPGEFTRKSGPSICFRGDAMQVAWILNSLSDNVLSDQYTEWGWRYKTHKDLIDDEFESEMPQEWLTYDTKSDAVLIVNSSDDDGSYEVASLIPRCPVSPPAKN